jgi:mersacidin/lichenicidin family type 2 lantibiotic
MYQPFLVHQGETNMSHVEIVRAWKDAEYRDSLSVEQRRLLPENPAGMIELSMEEMEQVAGGIYRASCNCCCPCTCTC